MVPNLVEYFLELVRIDSESKNERRIMDKLKDDLIKLGFSVDEDEAGTKIGGNAGNLYAYLPGKKELAPLLFCSHVDTVKPGNGVKPVYKDGLITTDKKTILGADDKSGVAEIIWGIKELIESGYEYPPLEIVLTISEEIGLLGARNFDTGKLKSRLGYAFDSEEVGEFMVGAPSQNTFLIKVFGKEAHAGVEPEKGISAIRVASEAIAAIPNGRIDHETTANIGTISGGLATNIVPNLVEIKGEARSHNKEKLEQVTNDILNTFRKTATRHKLDSAEARVEIEVKKEYESFYINDSHQLVQIAKKAMQQMGIEPKFDKGGGGSDANIFNAGGITMIVAGTGMYGYHTVDENIKVKDLEKGAASVIEIIKTYTEK